MSFSPPLCIGRKAIRIDQIVRLEADRNYTYIFLRDGSKQLMANTMAYYESALPSYFVRVHRSHYINLNEIKLMYKTTHSTIELKDGKHIPIARRRWKELKTQFRKLT